MMSFTENLDSCMERNMTLWSPESEEEHGFVRDFFGKKNLYHLGIMNVNSEQGWIGADNTEFLGNSYSKRINGTDDLSTVELNETSCIVFDARHNQYVAMSECVDAYGICKSNLGKNPV